jgi:carbon-monoxide dehydrogenase small subunit
MVLAALQLLEKNPHPSLDAIREGLSGNLCRCTGYLQIFEAVVKAAEKSPQEDQAAK